MNDNSDIVLAIETSTAAGSVALRVRGDMHCIELDKPQSQAKELIPSIERLFKDTGIWYEHLSAVCVTVGPGSFSGLRIGLSVARAIAFARPELPFHTFTTTECVMASYTGPHGQVMVVLPAGKGDVYTQAFEKKEGMWLSQTPISLNAPSELRHMPLPQLIGHGTPLLGDDSAPAAAPHARHMLDASAKVALSHPAPKPLYIRAPDAKIPTQSPI